MILNQATDYAFRAVLYLSKKTRGEVVEAREISVHEKIPMRFLLKIMPSLIKASIVRSYRGVGGGYALAKVPGDITLLDVLEAIEGPVRINKCLIDGGYCNKEAASHCAIHGALADIQGKLASELKTHSFAEFVK